MSSPGLLDVRGAFSPRECTGGTTISSRRVERDGTWPAGDRVYEEEAGMIKGMHLTFFTQDEDTLRSFFRDKLRLPSADAGGGWLIFDVPRGDLGCHPMGDETEVLQNTPGCFQTVSFYCNDIHETVAE